MNVSATQDTSESLHHFPLCHRTEHRRTSHGGFAKQQHDLVVTEKKRTYWVEKSGSVFGCYLSDSELWTPKMSSVGWLWYRFHNTHLDGPKNGREVL